MSRLISAFAIGVSLLFTAPFAAADPDGIFPLDFPIPFPWGTIEGTWVSQDAGVFAAFSFEVLDRDFCGDGKVLKVTQFDTLSHEIVASGNGMTYGRSYFVSAGMSGLGSVPYMLFVGAFEDRSGSRTKQYTALKLRSFNNLNDPGVLIKIRKVSNKVAKKWPLSPKAKD